MLLCYLRLLRYFYTHQGSTAGWLAMAIAIQSIRRLWGGLKISIRCRPLSTATRRITDDVRIVEVGPRDGLQNEKVTIPLQSKVELIRRLAQTGVRDIEAGSFVAPKWVPQVSRSCY